MTIVVFGSLIGFYGILQWLENPSAIYGLRQMTQAKPFGPFINQHHFAALMEMTGGLTLGLLFGGAFKRNRTPFLVLATVIMGMAIVLTGSRGGMLSFIGVVGLSLAASVLIGRREQANRADASRATGQLSAIAGGAAIILLIAGIAIFLGGGESLLRGVGLQYTGDDVTSGRGYFWQVALQIFLDHPIFGAGLDAFGAAFTRYDINAGLFRVEQAHNDYLQMLADAGIPGILCVLAFLYLLFSRGIRLIGGSGSALRRSVAVGALAGCFGIAIHSFFDFPLRTPANAYFFLMLSTLATVQVAERHSRRRSHRHQASRAEVKSAA
jgi:O-antigen ligase